MESFQNSRFIFYDYGFKFPLDIVVFKTKNSLLYQLLIKHLNVVILECAQNRSVRRG